MTYRQKLPTLKRHIDMFKLLRKIVRKVVQLFRKKSITVIYSTEVDTCSQDSGFQTGYGDGTINGFGV